jgi:hypothetical protein
VAVVGVGRVAASPLSMVRLGQLRGRQKRESLFLAGRLVGFDFQVVVAVLAMNSPHDTQVVGTIAVLVLICFMGGIGRSWELVGAPSLTALVRPGDDDAGGPSAR